MIDWLIDCIRHYEQWFSSTEEWKGMSGTVGGRYPGPGCFFWVLPKKSIPKPDQHKKDIVQRESLGTDML